MARLYPPVTEEVLPAFCLSYNEKGEKLGASIKINFNLNRAVAATEIKEIALRLRTISTNQYIIHEGIAENPETGISEGICLTCDLTAGTCLFQITAKNNPDQMENLKVGQYYKAQLAFIDNNGDIGYWSTVATIKCIAKPTVSIANYISNDVNIFTNKIVGEYIQDTTTGDSSEKAYSYRFQLFDKNNILLDDTGIQLHNSSNDSFSNSSTDSYYCYRELGDDEYYYLTYSVITINGFSIVSPRYQIIAAESIDPEENISLIIEKNTNSDWNPEEDGLIKIYPIIKDNPTKQITGNFVILRSSSKDNFKTWQEVRRFRLYNEVPKNKIIYDYTVEQGVTYRYALQQFNRAKFYSKKIINDNDIKADFEDMFLYDGKRQLKIRFNPKVSSFKNSLQEQKIDTIGSKYPFIFRNGNVCYKEFPIAGLISFQEDNSLFFIEKNNEKDTDDYRQMDLQRFEEKSRLNSVESHDIHYLENNLTYSKTDLTSENIMSERYFKLLVLDWLTDGRPKIFRSPTEGNYIVRLLNVNLTPKTELGRMIHEFSCTAYEIADFTYENLKNLGLLKSEEEINENENQWYSIDIGNIFNKENLTENGYYTIDLHNKKIIGFQCTGFYPGDIVKILTTNSIVPIEIMIGTTGSYIYDQGQEIISISILPKADPGDFSRNILFLTQGYTFQKFDTIAAIKTYTQMGEQLVGPVAGFFEKTIVNPEKGSYYTSPNVDLLPNGDGTKLRVTELLYLHAKKREIIPIFYNEETTNTNSSGASIIETPKFSLTPFGQGYINGKAIISKPTWMNGINLSQDELEKKREIHELVDFVIKNCNKDIFCLFEVYAPDNQNPIKNWIPYYEKGFWTAANNFAKYGKGFYGVYDPWLYREQAKKLSLDEQNRYEFLMGWWLFDTPSWGGNTPSSKIEDIFTNNKNYYKFKDTTITFYYDDGTKNIIDLNEKIEITLDNMKVPLSIDIGNCVIMEPIYRLQCFDYLIENENTKLQALKDNYLQIKKEAQQKINNYNNQLYLKVYGNLLLKEYNDNLAAMNMVSSYNDIVDTLTEVSRNNQIKQLKSYFSKEKSYVYILNNQVLEILETLMNSLNITDSSSLGIETNEIIQAKNNYDNFFNSSNKFSNNTPKLLAIEEINNIEQVKSEINNFIYHIQNNNQYNFDTIVSNIITTLLEKYNSINQILNDLEGQYYVGQYLELLNKRGIELFFDNVENLSLRKEYSNLLDYSLVYQLLNKNNINVNSLLNASIISSKWDNYFYLSSNDNNILALLELYYDAELQRYKIRNLNYYSESLGEVTLAKEIYNKINEKIDAFNNLIGSHGSSISAYTQQEKIELYNQKYTPRRYSNNENGYNIKQYLLGQISLTEDNSYYIDKISHTLEQRIDFIYQMNPGIEQAEFLTLFQQNDFYTSLPDIFKPMLLQYVTQYISTVDNISSPREIYQEITSYLSYYQSYSKELTQEQIDIILNIIEEYKNNRIFQDFTNTAHNDIVEFLNIWANDYSSIANSTEIDLKYQELCDYVADFNTIVQYKTNIVRQFKELRNRYISINTRYNQSDNIKDIFQNEENIYQIAIEDLQNAQNIFISQLELSQKDVLLQGYLDFLKVYLTNKNDFSVDTSTYWQKIQEAQSLAEMTIDENNSPYNQNLLIQKAWQEFLDALAIAYKEEIKERFG